MHKQLGICALTTFHHTELDDEFLLHNSLTVSSSSGSFNINMKYGDTPTSVEFETANAQLAAYLKFHGVKYSHTRTDDTGKGIFVFYNVPMKLVDEWKFMKCEQAKDFKRYADIMKNLIRNARSAADVAFD